jgi:hypothetical protein
VTTARETVVSRAASAVSLEACEDEGGDFLGRDEGLFIEGDEDLPARPGDEAVGRFAAFLDGKVGEGAAHESLDRGDGASGGKGAGAHRLGADEGLASDRPGHARGEEALAFFIREDDGKAGIDDADERMGRAEIDPDDELFVHDSVTVVSGGDEGKEPLAALLLPLLEKLERPEGGGGGGEMFPCFAASSNSTKRSR